MCRRTRTCRSSGRTSRPTAAACDRKVGGELVRARRAEGGLLLDLAGANGHPEAAVLIDGGAPHVCRPLPHVLAPQRRCVRRGADARMPRRRIRGPFAVTHPL